MQIAGVDDVDFAERTLHQYRQPFRLHHVIWSIEEISTSPDGHGTHRRYCA
jgi:hypothetical protein